MGVLAFRVEAEYEEAIKCRTELQRLENAMKSVNQTTAAGKKTYDDLEAEYYMVSKRLQELTSKAAEAAYYMGPDFKKKVADASRAVSDYASKLTEARKKLQDMIAASASYSDIKKQKDAIAQLSVGYLDAAKKQRALADSAKFGGKEISDILNDTNKGVDELGKKLGSGSPIDNALGILTGKMKAAFSVTAVSAFLRQVFNVRSYFQDIESSMEVFLGSQQKAAKFTKDLQDYAYYNMFEFSDLANASKQLIAYGNEVDKISGKGGILDQLSNIATATKVPLMELVNSWNKAKSTGSVNSRDVQSWAAKGLVLKDVLKDMGEEVKGNTVSFEQLQKAIAHVTEEGQMFGGIMDKMMPNLSSSKGQLEDNLKLMLNDIGKQLQEPMHDAIDFASNLVSNYEELGRIVADVAVVYGAAKGALVLYNVHENIHNTLQTIETINNRNLLASGKKLNILRYAGAKAQKALNASMLTNPYVLLAAAVVGLGVAVYRYNKAQNATLMTQKEINSYADKAHSAYMSEKKDLDELFSKIKLVKEGTDEYNDIKEEIVKRFGKYHSGLEQELSDVQNLDSAYASLATSIRNSARERAYNEAKSNLDEKHDKAQNKRLGNLRKQFENAYGDAVDENGMSIATQKYMQFLRDYDIGKVTVTGRKGKRNEAPGMNEFRYNGMLYKVQDDAFPTSYGERYQRVADARGGTRGYWAAQDLQEAIVKFIVGEQEYQKEGESLNNEINQERAELQKAFNAISDVKGVRDENGHLDTSLGGQSQALQNIIEEATVLKEKLKEKGVTSVHFEFAPDVELMSEEEVNEVVAKAKQQKSIVDRQIKDDETDANNKKKRAYSTRETREKNAQSLSRQAIDVAFNARQAEINNMYDEEEKQREALRLGYERQVEQFKRQREDFVKQLNDAARAEWLSAEDGREAYQFANPYRLEGNEIKGKTNATRDANARSIMADINRQEAESLDDYKNKMYSFIMEYGLFWEKRLAIANRYSDLIEKAEDGATKRALEKELDREQAKLERSKQSYLSQSQAFEDQITVIENSTEDAMGALRKSEDDLNAALEEAIEDTEKAKEKNEALAKEMAERFKGNVDLANRPQISDTRLAEAGWFPMEDATGATATVFSSSYDYADKNGVNHSILVTPILPDGTVLSEEELTRYLDETIAGADDFLAADSRHVIIAVDVDKEAGQKLHEMQQTYYDDQKTINDNAVNSIREEIALNKQNQQILLANRDLKIAELQSELAKKYGTDEDILIAQRALIETEANTIKDNKQRLLFLFRGRSSLYTSDKTTGNRTIDYQRAKTRVGNEYSDTLQKYKIEESLIQSQLADEKDEKNKAVLQAELKRNQEAQKQLERDYQSTLFSIETEGGSLEKVFGNISKYTKEQLDAAKQIGEIYLITNKENMSADDVKALQGALNDIEEARTQIDFRVGNDNLGAYIKNHEILNIKRAEYNALTDKTSDKAKKLSEELKQLDAQDKLDKEAVAISAFVSGINYAADAITRLGEATDNASLKDLGTVLSSAGSVAQSAWDGFKETGSLEAAAAMGVMDIGKQVVESFLSAEERAYRLRMSIEKLHNSALSFALDEKLKEGLDSIFGTNTQKSLQNAREVMDEIKKSQEDMRRDVIRGYWFQYGLGDGALERMEEGLGRKVDLGDFKITTAESFWGDSHATLASLAEETGWDLYNENGNLNAAFLKEILNTYEDISTAQRNWIEKAIRNSEKYDEALDMLRDNLSSLFSGLSGGLADATIEGLKSGAQQGSDEMKKIMSSTAQDLQKQMVKGVYDRYLAQFEDKAYELISGGGNEEDLLDLYATMFDQMGGTITMAQNTAERFKEMAEARGFSMNDLQNSNASSQAYQNISEQTGSAIDGRLASLQISSETKSQTLFQIGENVSQMLEQYSRQINIADDCRSILTDSYLALVAIRENTAGSLTAVKDIQNKVESIEKNIRNI